MSDFIFFELNFLTLPSPPAEWSPPRRGDAGSRGRIPALQMCIRDSIHFDHEKKVSFKCVLCGGDPRCVTHCISGALQFEEVDDAITRKRVRTDHKIKAMYLDANK